MLTRLYSRQAIKKYVKANNKIGDITPAQFNSHINRAIQQGVEKGHFDQPKGEFCNRACPCAANHACVVQVPLVR